MGYWVVQGHLIGSKSWQTFTKAVRESWVVISSCEEQQGSSTLQKAERSLALSKYQRIIYAFLWEAAKVAKTNQ